MSVLKIKKNGEWVKVGIGAQGPRGPAGPAGAGSGDMLESTYDPQGKATDIFKYVDDEIAAIPPPDMSSKVSKTGDTMTGALQMQPNGSSGYAKVYKNASADGDYGLQVQDVDPDGNFMGLTLSGKLQKLEFKKKKAGDADYTYTKLYDEDNPPSAEEVGALSEDGGTVYGNVTVETPYGGVTVKGGEGHTTELIKNGDAEGDYGTILRDTNGDAVAELKLSAANGNVKLKVGDKEYVLYHEGNIARAEEASF